MEGGKGDGRGQKLLTAASCKKPEDEKSKAVAAERAGFCHKNALLETQPFHKPTPSSLNEEALEALKGFSNPDSHSGTWFEFFRRFLLCYRCPGRCRLSGEGAASAQTGAGARKGEPVVAEFYHTAVMVQRCGQWRWRGLMRWLRARYRKVVGMHFLTGERDVLFVFCLFVRVYVLLVSSWKLLADTQKGAIPGQKPLNPTP